MRDRSDSRSVCKTKCDDRLFAVAITSSLSNALVNCTANVCNNNVVSINDRQNSESAFGAAPVLSVADAIYYSRRHFIYFTALQGTGRAQMWGGSNSTRRCKLGKNVSPMTVLCCDEQCKQTLFYLRIAGARELEAPKYRVVQKNCTKFMAP